MSDQINDTDLDIEKESAVFNEREVVVEIPILKQSWLDKVLRRPALKKYTVRQPPLGVMEEIGAIVWNIKKYGMPEEGSNTTADMFLRFKTDITAIIKVIACLLDCRAYPTDTTLKFIRENVQPAEAKLLVMKLFEVGDIESFLSTIILMKGMSLKKPEGIIASAKKEDKTHGEP